MPAQVTVHFHSCLLEVTKVQGQTKTSRLSADAPFMAKTLCISISIRVTFPRTRGENESDDSSQSTEFPAQSNNGGLTGCTDVGTTRRDDMKHGTCLILGR